MASMPSIGETYSPCRPFSTYHDLACGHRVRTPYPEVCGGNCAKPCEYYPFLCATCTTAEVQAEVAFRALQIEPSSQSTDGAPTCTSGSADMRAVAQELIARRMYEGYRICELAPKIDAVLQFFNEFPEAQESGGFLDDAAYAAMDPPVSPRKRPGAKGPLMNGATASNPRHAQATRAGSSMGDQAVVVVEELLGGLVLEERRKRGSNV